MGQGSKATKVFCIGFMKTGTTTLNRALSLLGYRVSDDSWKWLHDIVREDWESVQSKMNEWDAAEDNPIPLIFKKLDELFPGSKFILSIRDEEKWYASVSYHIGNLRSPMHAWLFGKGKEVPKADKEHTLEVYRAHIDNVRNHFKDRPEDLLELDVTQMAGWRVLCDFLGEPIPDQPLPHANSTTFSEDKNAGFNARLKYWKKRVFHPLKIKQMDRNGYLPSPTQRTKRT